ncbi:hypothetical protein ACVLD2_000014 [Paenibacillus sp. PvR052]|nr:hypothetical protein [Paenibacillus sp. PvP091]MBP1168551.1 hypothetical protein [Paenibacillus sp. PvR098]MBP2439579.1 hypothetical protein [Paenibacillus sp. PvP052]
MKYREHSFFCYVKTDSMKLADTDGTWGYLCNGSI